VERIDENKASILDMKKLLQALGTYVLYSVSFQYTRNLHCKGHQGNLRVKLRVLLYIPLIKKKIKFSSYIRDQLQSHDSSCLLNPHIWLNIRAFPHILGSPSSYMNFPILYVRKISFSFLSVHVIGCIREQCWEDGAEDEEGGEAADGAR
jgi:hypothetical protein